MCGIAGFVDFHCRSNKSILHDMTFALEHRGPDDFGLHLCQQGEAQIGFGHRRLSIIDLSSSGHQPMDFDQLTIVFNGEIYNFSELKLELEKSGYSFISHSDTEVVLKAYHYWGKDAVDKFIGMFSIAIIDRSKEKLVLIRDRAGIKPLYYYFKNGLFLFASELKCFHRHPAFCKEIDFSSVAMFLELGYVPQPNCIFNNAKKLRPGHCLELSLKNREMIESQYWDIKKFYNLPKLDISENEAVDQTEKLLRSAFNYRMVADVPVGVFLSGGFDSSVVTAILQADRAEKLKTFTIGFIEEDFNEAGHAKKVAAHLGTEHTEHYCSQREALDILPRLPEIYDEPFGDSSAIPTILLSRLARKQVTVSLSADGGDEIFAGYEKYSLILRKLRRWSSVPGFLKSLLRVLLQNRNMQNIASRLGVVSAGEKFSRSAMVLESDEKRLLRIFGSYWTQPEIRNLLIKQFDFPATEFDAEISHDRLSNLLAIDYTSYLTDDILVKVDRATMSVGLEGRDPMLDHRIVEFVAQLPADLKLRSEQNKYLLKKIAYKYLPREIMDRPKMGFSVPIAQWFRKELKSYLQHYLDPQRLKAAGIFSPESVEQLKTEYFSGIRPDCNKLWLLLIFEMWREKWA